MITRLKQCARIGLISLYAAVIMALVSGGAMAAPYAAMVIDARSGEVLHAANADTRLHPASLTKMMTLYIAFEAIENGEISLDSDVRISSKAANEPPSKLGLRAGQTIKLRYLIRAAAIKSANDASTAIAEAISGTESAFADRMNRTARAMGMNNTTFRNAHGLTQEGHLSTARDMTVMGRHLFYDFPEYYNLFSRTTADAGVAQVAHSNRRFLNDFRGADGIKTGYTRAAGFNLVASAERGQKRIIATMFGGSSTAARNERVAELLNMGFSRVPERVAVVRPAKPPYQGGTMVAANGAMPAGKVVRVAINITNSPRPVPRPIATPAVDDATLLAMQANILDAVAQAQTIPEPDVTTDAATQEAVAIAAAAAASALVPAATPVLRPDTATPEPAEIAAVEVDIEAEVAAVEAEAEITPVEVAMAMPPRVVPLLRPAPAEPAVIAAAEEPLAAPIAPQPRPDDVVLAAVAAEPQEVVTRMSTSGGRHWGINIGTYNSHAQAERVLLTTALQEISTLDESLRKVVNGNRGYEANFVGLSQEAAAMACSRLSARNMECTPFGPS